MIRAPSERYLLKQRDTRCDRNPNQLVAHPQIIDLGVVLEENATRLGHAAFIALNIVNYIKTRSRHNTPPRERVHREPLFLSSSY